MWGILTKFIENISQYLSVIAIIAGLSWVRREAIPSWWRQMRKRNDDFVCYAIFLTLPADHEAIKYMNDSWEELNMVSGNECMIMSFQNDSIRASQNSDFSILNDNRNWKKSIKNNARYSAIFAEIFKIELTEFPCLLLFKDLDSSEYALVSLKGMSSDEIAMRVRKIFAVVKKAAAESINPIIALNREIRGNTIKLTVKTAGEKTLGIMFEAFFNSIKGT